MNKNNNNSEVHYHRNFIKSYKKRISKNNKLVKKFDERVELFMLDRNNAVLADHQLSGKFNNYRAFSVAGDLRVVYLLEDDKIILMDIGTHAQAYGM